MAVYRVYVEKKEDYAVEAAHVLADLQTGLNLTGLKKLRLLNRYDVEGLSQEQFTQAVENILSEPPVDDTYAELPQKAGTRVFAVEYLPGQFDQRADSAAQCISLLTQQPRPLVRNARVYLLEGKLTDEEFEKVKHYLINPVEAREASLDPVETLEMNYAIPTQVETLDGFIQLSREELEQFIAKYGLAMDLDDILFCQEYFAKEEQRDPTITEIRMIDTYWSDHCRHTTFSTHIDHVEIEEPAIQQAYEDYLNARKELGRENKPMTLMDLATIGARQLKAEGKLTDQDESEEINACSVKIKVTMDDGSKEDWLLMFKNEPTTTPPKLNPSAVLLPAWRRHPGSPVRPELCLPGHAGHRRRRPPDPGERNHRRQTAPEKAGQRRCQRLLLLRQPNRSGHRPGL